MLISHFFLFLMNDFSARYFSRRLCIGSLYDKDKDSGRTKKKIRLLQT